ncbi:MAG: sporulation stage IV protein A [Butyricicoccaceae bacterium]
MPDDARGKIRETLEKIINENAGGLICIILAVDKQGHFRTANGDAPVPS